MVNNFTTPVREPPLARLDDNKPLPQRNLPAKPVVGAVPVAPLSATDKANRAQKDAQQDRKRRRTKPSTLCMTPPSLIKNNEGVNYHRGSCIGEGGFARCFQVKNGDDETFAAKTIAKAALTNSKTRDKLITEIDIHRQLDHPNLVKFIDCFEDHENVYMLLEMCSNRSLADLVHRRHNITEEEARYWAVQILGAIGHMHSRGVIHRDLKLGNIFLDKEMNVKVGDFGLAAVVERGRRRYTVCGTPNYISPELLNSPHAHDQSVDIWALGIIIYSMLVGRPPFQDREVDRIYTRIREYKSGFPPAPSSQYQEAWEAVSEEAREFIGAMLNPDPLLRPTFRECLNSPWITNGPYPSRISSRALVMKPNITVENSKMTFDHLLRTTHLDEMCAPGGYHVEGVRPLVNNKNSVGGPSTSASTSEYASQDRRVLPHHISPPSTKDKYKPVAVRDEAKAQVHQQDIPVYDSPVVGRKLVDRTAGTNNDVNSPGFGRQQRFATLEQQQARQSRNLFPVTAMRTSTGANNVAAVGTRNLSSAPPAPRPASNGPPRLLQRPADTPYRNVIAPLQLALRQTVSNIEEGLKTYSRLPEIGIAGHPYVAPPLVVTRWADFEDSWGVSYCLSDGSIGMLFRDSSTLRYDPLMHTYMYYEQRTKPGFLTMHRTAAETTDPKRQKKVNVLNYVKEYMDRELAHAIDFERTGGDLSKGETLHYVQKTNAFIMFVQTDGTVQFNFKDHSKVIVHDKGTKIGFITDARQLYSWTLETSIRATKSPYWKHYDFTNKLRVIAEALSRYNQYLSAALIKDKSHPKKSA